MKITLEIENKWAEYENGEVTYKLENPGILNKAIIPEDWNLIQIFKFMEGLLSG